ncbi:MAG: hypothetical protein ABI831_11005 [Betaproteobacteria bacterium]
MLPTMNGLHPKPAAGIRMLLLCAFLAFLSSATAVAQSPYWAFGTGGTGTDEAFGIAADAAGNSYVTGDFTGTVNFGSGEVRTSMGDADIFVAKYDSAGNLLWLQQAGGIENSGGQAIAVDAAGNTYVTGNFALSAKFPLIPRAPAVRDPVETITSTVSYTAGFIASYDSGGNLRWARRMVDDGLGFGIAVDTANGVYVTGGFIGANDFGTGQVFDAGGLNDIFVAKYDASGGGALWANAFAGAGDDAGRAIAVAGGGVYITGSFNEAVSFGPAGTLTESNFLDGAFVAKVDSATGNPVWAKSGSPFQVGAGIAVDGSGNSYVSGNGGIAKYDDNPNNPNRLWIASAPGVYGEGIAIDAAGNSYVTGFFFGSVAFYPPGAGFPPVGPPTGTATAPDNTSALFFAKYDSGGNLVGFQKAGTAGSYAYGEAIAVAGGNAYITGRFVGTAAFPLDGAPVATLNSVGGLDILRAKYAGGAGGTSGPTRFAVFPQPSTAIAGQTISVTVTALDQSGNPVAYNGTIHFSSSDGSATLPPDTLMTTGGPLSFPVTLRAAGPQTITVSDAAIVSLAGQANVNVSAGQASRFLFTDLPTGPVVAGQQFSFKVKAADAFNNFVPGYTGSISLTGDRSIPTCSGCNMPFVGGIGNISATLGAAGPNILQATDTVQTSIKGTSSAITVIGGAATKLRVFAPLSTNAGSPINVSVVALDQFNNVANGYTGTVHFTSSDANAILPPDSMLMSSSGTFAAVLNTAGPQTLTATDTVVPSITGTFNPVNVTGSAAPTPVGQNVVVQPTDANGVLQPISLTFSSVSVSGGTTAVPMQATPPSNFSLNGTAYDITTTAQYTPPVKVCFTGSFTSSDVILHYESGAWVALPNQQLLPAGPGPYSTICADTNSLSPFGVFTALSSPIATLDVDQSITASKYDALTDGLLVLRYLFGLTGSSLTNGALGGTATRTDPAVIKTYLDGIRTSSLDIDGNGTVDALTDGLLVLRYLFGLRGSALIAGAFDPTGSRTTAAAIEAYIQSLMP